MALWQTVLRILQHSSLGAADVRRAVPPALLERLGQRVSASEQRHTGEIRIYVEAGLPLSYLWRDAAARERAVMLFGKLRVWDTEHNNGVLIYLLLAERSIELVADRGLNQRISAPEWQAMVKHLGTALQASHYEEGLTQALEEVSAALVQYFPLQAGQLRSNELPNLPLLNDAG
ncbi:TLP18.3, Psb32 and MOLO-1 founding protein of phosphatase [Rhodoferax sp. OV413]|uniref:TPM domain-containing protein n=1 Tax=Rhodoferax sp. OV413 TaxID=1855285 RepID=UPI0008851B05|nr:TPM domain-containing protein [Rhodoferax sp. OV413]SDP70312.1 TLP18.3, Psb32 and MOLO-1 founding protein of phosphatase [Rhodoferax sp. OV413]